MSKFSTEFWSAELDRTTPELDVHGLRVEAALQDVDHFIDRHLTGNRRAIKIIHGVGTGALRNALTAWLAHHPAVRAYRLSDRTDELAAVTYVLLK